MLEGLSEGSWGLLQDHLPSLATGGLDDTKIKDKLEWDFR